MKFPLFLMLVCLPLFAAAQSIASNGEVPPPKTHLPYADSATVLQVGLLFEKLKQFELPGGEDVPLDTPTFTVDPQLGEMKFIYPITERPQLQITFALTFVRDQVFWMAYNLGAVTKFVEIDFNDAPTRYSKYTVRRTDVIILYFE